MFIPLDSKVLAARERLHYLSVGNRRSSVDPSDLRTDSYRLADLSQGICMTAEEMNIRSAAEVRFVKPHEDSSSTSFEGLGMLWYAHGYEAK